MSKCAYCSVIEKKHKVIYEDDVCYALPVTKPAVPGHLVLMPKEHYPIVEQVPDEVMSHLFVTANRLSVAAFEGLHAQGTNIIIPNGVAAGQTHAHMLMHLLPRKQDDGLAFAWKAEPVSEEALNESAKTLAREFVAAEKEEVHIPSDPEQYLLDQLNRLP